MVHIEGGWRRALGAGLAAAGLVAGLTGCEIAGFTLPDISLPQDLNLPTIEIPFLDGTTDRAEALDALAREEAITSPTIREASTLTVGINSHTSLAPMVMSSADGTSIFGLDVDLATALADELGLKVRFVSVDDADTAVEDTVDIVLSTSSGSVESATVVGAYAEEALGFFHRGATEVVSVEALTGASVGVQPGSASKAALDRTALGMDAREYGTLNDAFAALEAGEVDYVLCDAYAGAYLATGYDDIAFAGSLNAPVSRGVAVSSSNVALRQAVQEALTTIQTNGVLDLARQRWVGAFPPLSLLQQISDVPQAQDEAEAEDAADAEAEDAEPTASE